MPTEPLTYIEALDSAQEALAMLGCPYLLAHNTDGEVIREGRHGPGTCDQGCYQEPCCTTNSGPGGWERQLLDAARSLISDDSSQAET